MDCPDMVEPAIVVEIRDARTGAPRAADAQGVLIDGAFQDTLVPHGFTGDGVMTSRQGAYERSGTYTVLVTHPGYERWFRQEVRVGEGVCGVETRTLTAELDTLDAS